MDLEGVRWGAFGDHVEFFLDLTMTFQDVADTPQTTTTAPALGPEVHRRHPVGPPGADLVDLLKRRELDSTSPRL